MPSMRARSQLRRELTPYLILLTGLVVTAATARYVYSNGTARDSLELQTRAEAASAEIHSRLQSYMAMLLGGAGLFAASDDVSRAEFKAYVDRLDLAARYPGIQGIGFSRRIVAAERDAVLAEARRDVPDFRFWPEPAAPEFHAILYLEPQDPRNRHALGFDMASDQRRRDAMMRARDSGSPAATGRVRLVQEAVEPVEEQAGFLIYVPVYRGGHVPATVEGRRAALLGFVYSPFRADDLLRGIFSPNQASPSGLEVFEGSFGDGQLLHRSPLPEPGLSRSASINTIDVAGRSWTILVRDVDDMSAATQAMVGLIVLGGALLSTLLFLIVRTQVQAWREAERAAEEHRASEEKLRAVDREKDAFLATISHELRTPLNAIVGWASMLGRGVVPKETQTHAIEVIKRNAAAQTRLIEDLLDMSRAAAGHLNLHVADVDARAALEAALDAVRPAAEAAGLTVRVEFGPHLGVIEADAARVQQIVMNLLSNSVKFTPRGGQVTLTAQRSHGVLTIAVADTGIGIDPAFAPFLFDRFKQADSSPTRAHSGAGLGLAIVRHLVELHGGTVEGASQGPNTGATFTVRLPTSRRRRTA
jgi:signal transduction histidine kinase